MDFIEKMVQEFAEKFEKYPPDRQAQTHASAAYTCMLSLKEVLKKHGTESLSEETIYGIIKLNEEYLFVTNSLLDEVRKRKLERMPCVGES